MGHSGIIGNIDRKLDIDMIISFACKNVTYFIWLGDGAYISYSYSGGNMGSSRVNNYDVKTVEVCLLKFQKNVTDLV